MYTMMALGLTMSYSVTKISNFAHAELVTLGGYITALGVNRWGLGLWKHNGSHHIQTVWINRRLLFGARSLP